ncbi:hypothetical protein Tco_0477525 [Tanacetum coccineum]
MHYPRFTKVIIDHFISKDNTISMRNRINLHTSRDDSLLGALKFVSKTEDCQKYGALIPDGMINHDIRQSQAYKNYLDYATGKVPPKKARKFKKPASPKLKTIPASPKDQKGKRVKRPAKKATTAPSTGVVIRDTHAKSISKKKAPAKADRGKGIELLSDAALLKDAQLKKTLSEDESDDVYDEDGNDDDDGNGDDSGIDDDDGGNDAQDSKRTNSDDDENPSFTLKGYEEEEQEDEYVHTQETDKFDDEEKMHEEEDDDVAKELYGDLNITQGLKDTDMTNVEQGGEDQQNASHESEDEMIKTRMKTPLLDQTEGRKEEIQARMLNHQKAQSQRNQSHQALPKAPDLSLNLRKPDKPPNPNRALNKSKSVNFRPPQKWISTIAKARQPPCIFDELMGTPIDFSAYVMNRLKIDNLTQEILEGPAFNLLKGTCKSFAKLEYHFEECYKAVNDRLDWHNPEGRGYPFDLSKLLPLIED